MRVLHYTLRWLEPSQRFVHAYVSGSRHPGPVVSRRRPCHTDLFPAGKVWSLEAFERRWIPRSYRFRSAMIETVALLAGASAIHVHFGYAAPDLEGVVARRGFPLVISMHGHDVTAYPRRHPGHYDRIVDCTAAVVCPSGWLADRVAELGFPPESIAVVPSGVDTGFFTEWPVPEPPRVAFVGRLVEKKGVDVLLDAWPKIADAVRGATLHIVGDGPLAPVVRAVGRDDVVWDPPRLADMGAQVRDALRAATVVVTPSRTGPDGDAESLLLVNLEAAATGRAVVSTRHGGIPEYALDGETALLVDEGDADALADAVVAVLRDRELAARLGGAGVRWAAQLDVESCTAQRDAVMEAAVSGDRLLVPS